MYFDEYRDYRHDGRLMHHSLHSGRGVVGCEMREFFGWGDTLHRRGRPLFFPELPASSIAPEREEL